MADIRRLVRAASLAIALLLALAAVVRPAVAADPLPSWRDGAARARIVQFVQAVTDPRGMDYVPPAERVAVFDNMISRCSNGRRRGAGRAWR